MVVECAAWRCWRGVGKVHGAGPRWRCSRHDVTRLGLLQSVVSLGTMRSTEVAVQGRRLLQRRILVAPAASVNKYCQYSSNLNQAKPESTYVSEQYNISPWGINCFSQVMLQIEKISQSKFYGITNRRDGSLPKLRKALPLDYRTPRCTPGCLVPASGHWMECVVGSWLVACIAQELQ